MIYSALKISVSGKVRSTIRNVSRCPFSGVRLLNMCMACNLYIFLRSPCRLSFQTFMGNSFPWRAERCGQGTRDLEEILISGKYRRDIISIIKDVRAKIFLSIDFFKNFYCSQIMKYLCKRCKTIEGHWLRFRDKACGKLPYFEKLAQVIKGVVKNMEGESTKANDLSHTW